MNFDRFPLGDLMDDWHLLPYGEGTPYTFPDGDSDAGETTSGECGMAKAVNAPIFSDAPQSDGQTTANAANERNYENKPNG